MKCNFISQILIRFFKEKRYWNQIYHTNTCKSCLQEIMCSNYLKFVDEPSRFTVYMHHMFNSYTSAKILYPQFLNILLPIAIKELKKALKEYGITEDLYIQNFNKFHGKNCRNIEDVSQYLIYIHENVFCLVRNAFLWGNTDWGEINRIFIRNVLKKFFTPIHKLDIV